MSNLKYLDKTELIEKCSIGKINIHSPIKLKNKSQNTLHYVSFINHILHFCTDNKDNLLKILFKIKSQIEQNMKKSLKNYYFDQCIEQSINEWNLTLNADDIFKNNNKKYDYNEFLKMNKNYNEFIFNMNGLENIIEQKNNKYDEDIKDSIILIIENCEEYIELVEEQLQYSIDIIKNIEPEHLYLLIDLSTKNKDVYMEYIDNNTKNASFFENMITNKNNIEIYDNINTIFLNYIYIINMLKKELHYIITVYKSILQKLIEKLSSLGKLKDSLNIKYNIKSLDKSKILEEDIVDREKEEVEENLTFF